MHKVLAFLKSLEENNTREWFSSNKSSYLKAEVEFKELVFAIQDRLAAIDNILIDSTKIFRIYRDIRFSEDKTPFHIHRSASFKRASDKLRGGYYLRVAGESASIIGGFFAPNSTDILHIRKQIQQDPSLLREVLRSEDLTNYFGGLQGDQVKSAPRGFSKDDPAIDLLKFKQLLLRKDFTIKEILSPDFSHTIVEGYVKMRPFFDYMSEILTTDLNGETRF